MFYGYSFSSRILEQVNTFTTGALMEQETFQAL
jgi:hypothetical protein